MEQLIKDKGSFQARIAGRITTSGEDYYNSKQCEEDFKKAADIIKTNSNGKLAPVFLLIIHQFTRHDQKILSMSIT